MISIIPSENRALKQHTQTINGDKVMVSEFSHLISDCPTEASKLGLAKKRSKLKHKAQPVIQP